MTETEPDLLDYTEQAHALVVELQRLSSMRAALDDAATLLRDGATLIGSATVTVSEATELAAIEFDEAQRIASESMQTALERMNESVALANSATKVFEELNGLKAASDAVNSATGQLLESASVFDSYGDKVDSALVALHSASSQLTTIEEILKSAGETIDVSHDSFGKAAAQLWTATADYSEHVEYTREGAQSLRRATETLNQTTGDLANSQTTLTKALQLLDRSCASLGTAASDVADKTLVLDQAAKGLADGLGQITNVRSTLEAARDGIDSVLETARQQGVTIDQAAKEIRAYRSAFEDVTTHLIQKQDALYANVLAIESDFRSRNQQLQAGLGQLERQQVSLEAKATSVDARLREHSRQLGQIRMLAIVATILAIIIVVGVGILLAPQVLSRGS